VPVENIATITQSQIPLIDLTIEESIPLIDLTNDNDSIPLIDLTNDDEIEEQINTNEGPNFEVFDINYEPVTQQTVQSNSEEPIQTDNEELVPHS